MTCWLHCSDGQNGDTEVPPCLHIITTARPSNSRKSPFCYAAIRRQTSAPSSRAISSRQSCPASQAQQAMRRVSDKMGSERDIEEPTPVQDTIARASTWAANLKPGTHIPTSYILFVVGAVTSLLALSPSGHRFRQGKRRTGFTEASLPTCTH